MEIWVHEHLRPSMMTLHGCIVDNEMLGAGGEAEVYKGEYDGKMVACKHIRIPKPSGTQVSGCEIFFQTKH
jgi:hypothetical protein